MKKYKIAAFAVLAAVLSVSLSGCWWNNKFAKVEPMDELNAENLYHYQNKDLGFEMYLPQDFIYYQTQRNNNDDFSELIIYVPTADTSLPTELQSYAKPVIVRIFNKKYWDESLNDEEREGYVKVGEKGDKVYTLLFWQKIPSDWTVKWTDDMKQTIIDNFQVK